MGHWREKGEPVSYHWPLSIRPENIRNLWFPVFGGYRKGTLKQVNETQLECNSLYGTFCGKFI